MFVMCAIRDNPAARSRSETREEEKKKEEEKKEEKEKETERRNIKNKKYYTVNVSLVFYLLAPSPFAQVVSFDQSM